MSGSDIATLFSPFASTLGITKAQELLGANHSPLVAYVNNKTAFNSYMQHVAVPMDGTTAGVTVQSVLTVTGLERSLAQNSDGTLVTVTPGTNTYVTSNASTSFSTAPTSLNINTFLSWNTPSQKEYINLHSTSNAPLTIGPTGNQITVFISQDNSKVYVADTLDFNTVIGMPYADQNVLLSIPSFMNQQAPALGLIPNGSSTLQDAQTLLQQYINSKKASMSTNAPSSENGSTSSIYMNDVNLALFTQEMDVVYQQSTSSSTVFVSQKDFQDNIDDIFNRYTACRAYTYSSTYGGPDNSFNPNTGLASYVTDLDGGVGRTAVIQQMLSSQKALLSIRQQESISLSTTTSNSLYYQIPQRFSYLNDRNSNARDFLTAKVQGTQNQQQDLNVIQTLTNACQATFDVTDSSNKQRFMDITFGQLKAGVAAKDPRYIAVSLFMLQNEANYQPSYAPTPVEILENIRRPAPPDGWVNSRNDDNTKVFNEVSKNAVDQFASQLSNYSSTIGQAVQADTNKSSYYDRLSNSTQQASSTVLSSTGQMLTYVVQNILQ